MEVGTLWFLCKFLVLMTVEANNLQLSRIHTCTPLVICAVKEYSITYIGCDGCLFASFGQNIPFEYRGCFLSICMAELCAYAQNARAVAARIHEGRV